MSPAFGLTFTTFDRLQIKKACQRRARQPLCSSSSNLAQNMRLNSYLHGISGWKYHKSGQHTTATKVNDSGIQSYHIHKAVCIWPAGTVINQMPKGWLLTSMARINTICFCKEMLLTEMTQQDKALGHKLATICCHHKSLTITDTTLIDPFNHSQIANKCQTPYVTGNRAQFPYELLISRHLPRWNITRKGESPSFCLSSRELTYPTLGKRLIIFKSVLVGDMLVLDSFREFILFWVDDLTKTLCFSRHTWFIDPPSSPPLDQPRGKACRNCAGFAVTGATGSPTGRGTVVTGCGTACGTGCRTYLCDCPGHVSQQEGLEFNRISWCLPKCLEKRVQHLFPNYLKWQKHFQQYYIILPKDLDVSCWILVSIFVVLSSLSLSPLIWYLYLQPIS